MVMKFQRAETLVPILYSSFRIDERGSWVLSLHQGFLFLIMVICLVQAKQGGGGFNRRDRIYVPGRVLGMVLVEILRSN
ncbi:hypothetical protein GBA52_028904 [Prunus armeniaca]|nr:hypothetical protein GBA52_028904 [Prunus armeniaca]